MGTNKTERILVFSIGVLLVALAGVIASSFREKVIRIGDKAPDFSIATDAGRTVSRANFGGRLLVLNFWATWCPPCIQEMPSLDEFQKRLRSSGVVVLGVSVDRDETAYKAFLQRAGVSFLTARDPGAAISAEYGTFKYPETYVIGADGRVLQKHIGPEVWTDETLINGIRALL
jgi:cytochrome c biogenesis protein CcmG/thiol:disulfide interchange protein DsbE